MLFAKPKYEYGITSFNAYRVNHNISKEVFYKKFSCRNDEFVKLLKSGKCESITGEEIKSDDW